MNLPQRIVLAIGALAIVGMSVVPPWILVYNNVGLRAERFAGYYPIWQNNNPAEYPLSDLFGLGGRHYPLAMFSTRLDTTKLSIQMAAALLITALLTVLFKTKRQDG